MSYVQVSSLTRGCQYTDEKNHVCARLAVWNSFRVVGSERVWQVFLTCMDHRPDPNAGSSLIDTDETFGLGYRP